MIGKIILAHLCGDYLIQTHHQAVEKTQSWAPAIAHGLTYTVPFLGITRSVPALLVISGTHMVIDHYRLAKHVIWFKNQFAPKRYRQPYKDTVNGFPKETPIWMSTWIMIISDNTIHLLLNAAAIKALDKK